MLKTLTHHRFTIDDYHRMIDTAILTENDRVELIRGEILNKMSIGDPHCACVKRLNKRFGQILQDMVVMGVQDPIQLDDSEPEPDISLMRPRDDFYASGKPQADDVLLVVEVADSSLDFDRDVKGPMYAEAGIVDYWVVNLNESRVEIYRDPRPDGSFGVHQIALPGQLIDLAALPGISIAVDDFLLKA